VDSTQRHNLFLHLLVSRLSIVLPTPFHAEVTSTGFRLSYQEDIELEISIQELWEGERSDKDNIFIYSHSVLSNTQDAITMVIHDVWPKIDTQPTSLPVPEVHWSDNKLELSFQLDNQTVLRLEPIDFDGLLK
jgi:hypothetical protein